MTTLWHELDTMQIQMNQIAYECVICENHFTSPIQLTVHCIVQHAAAPCIHCLKLFPTEQFLSEHIRKYHAVIKHICIDCKSEYCNERDLYFHLIRIHFQKQCQLCNKLVSFDNYQNHMETSHNVTNYTTTIELNLNCDQFHCHLCIDSRPINRLEKLFTHLLFYHKSSLKSLLQCISNDNEWKSFQSIECNETRAKCSKCDCIYSWSIPKIFHQIYCQHLIYCRTCNICFENQFKYVEHKLSCTPKITELKFCDNCNINDELHLKNVHKISENIETNECSLINSKNDCNFCGTNLNTEAKHLNQLIEHFSNLHQLNARAILNCLKNRNDKIELNAIQCSSNKRPAILNNKEILTIVKHDKNANAECHTDFDAKLVKCVYSSVSDFDTSESDNDGNKSKISKSLYRCDFCTNRSKSKFVHAMHMHKRHGFQMKTPEFKCNVCRKTFKSNRCLRKHNQNLHHKVHATEKRFKCPFCEFRCNGKSRMR